MVTVTKDPSSTKFGIATITATSTSYSTRSYAPLDISDREDWDTDDDATLDNNLPKAVSARLVLAFTVVILMAVGTVTTLRHTKPRVSTTDEPETGVANSLSLQSPFATVNNNGHDDDHAQPHANRIPSTLPLSTPTSSPVLSFRATEVTKYINSIKLSNGTLAVPQTPPPPPPINTTTTTTTYSTTAEEAALAWLIYVDPLQLSPDSEMNRFRLRQRYALLTLALQLPIGYRAPSSSNTDECNWVIVAKCTKSTAPTILEGANVVTAIVVGYRKIRGLPAHLGLLTPDLGLLTSLERFSLGDGGWTGRLASTLGVTWTNLTMFVASRNDLTGSLPPALGKTWTKLTTFDVSENAFSGSLPSSLGATWTSLKLFSVGNNALTGSLPSSLGTTWTNLERFAVFSNALSGSLPASLGTTWDKIVSFSMFQNELTGSLPSLLGTTWTNLATFAVSYNDLTGTIPSLVSHWKKLSYAFFNNNSLVGSMPSGICNFSTLVVLQADCTDEVVCSCCTSCCSDTNATNRCKLHV